MDKNAITFTIIQKKIPKIDKRFHGKRSLTIQILEKTKFFVQEFLKGRYALIQIDAKRRIYHNLMVFSNRHSHFDLVVSFLKKSNFLKLKNIKYHKIK